MPLAKGQVPFGEMTLPMRTCHDIRLWRGCPGCMNLGSKNNMVRLSNDQFWHGRCFAEKFGVDRLLQMPREETVKLTLGDLGVDLMGRLLDKIDA